MDYRGNGGIQGVSASNLHASRVNKGLTARRILYNKAASRLPNYEKGPSDFYIAILPPKKNVRDCKSDDFFWLKVRGVGSLQFPPMHAIDQRIEAHHWSIEKSLYQGGGYESETC